ncbi:glutamate-5-semialdehyde dehydrogenase [Neisseriaceae bacterium PsAf]|nr:glutamate-5-semialdehyde dehydrogenase [Neisseriaceae bacterium PsAf]
MNAKDYMTKLAQEAKQSAYLLAQLETQQKNNVLKTIAEVLEKNRNDLKKANQLDLEAAKQKNLASALIDRLVLNDKVIDGMIAGLEQIITLADPIGEMGDFHYQPSGILVGKMRVPLGVIGIIYESRPNVTIDAFALCFKSGNACVLRGGSEAINSNQAIAHCIRTALTKNDLPESILGFVEDTDRALVGEMLQASGLIDVIIPRGGKSLVKRISDEARIPVIKHLDGICHIYLDDEINTQEAIEISINAKTSRYGTCNTLETLLVHEKIASQILPLLEKEFQSKKVELRGCEKTLKILPGITLATENDWHTEYLAPILSIKIVSDLETAIEHINYHGSHHTDAIITTNYEHSRQFLRAVDSASVMVNASTRFADGFEYGLGAEIGISTDKLHARGPVGLLGLTSEKWIVLGSGQVRN